MTGRPFTLIAAIIFAAIALIHAYRIVTGFPVVIGAHAIGQGVSWVALVITGALSVGLFREAHR